MCSCIMINLKKAAPDLMKAKCFADYWAIYTTKKIWAGRGMQHLLLAVPY